MTSLFGLAPLQADLQPIHLELRSIRADVAKVNNRSSALPVHPIMPVPRDSTLPAAQIPAEFPETLGALRALNGQQLSNCLAYYGLPANGSVEDKKGRMATHLGALHI
jgi:hypothetical protein